MTLLRFMIVVVVLATVLLRLSSRETYLETMDHDAQTAIMDAVANAGAMIFENPVDRSRISGHMIYFHEEGCSARSVAFAFGIASDSRAMTQRIQGPTWSPRIMYFDRVLPHQDRAVLIGTWLQERIRAVLGLSASIPVGKAVYYSAPPDCIDKSAIDWRTVWEPKVPS